MLRELIKRRFGNLATNRKRNSCWHVGTDAGILVMAPMEDVTDVAFREAFAEFSPVGRFVFFTEFTSADGLLKAPPEGHRLVAARLLKTPRQHPIVAQLFSADPDMLAEAAERFVLPAGFAGVDINMGCPDKAIIKQGAGSALIEDPKRAAAMIRAVQKAVGKKLCVSVKTRIGFRRIDMEWIRTILSVGIDVLTVHLRTTKELSLVPAHWELMPEIVALRNKLSPQTIIIGNGDVSSVAEARAKMQETGCDGVMIGRGLFGNPAFFAQEAEDTRSPAEKIQQLIYHLRQFDALLFRERLKPFHIMKKHFKAYLAGFSGAKELRMHLMETGTPQEALSLLQEAQEKIRKL